jgi:hypothetical protein
MTLIKRDCDRSLTAECIREELLRAFGTAKIRTPPSLQCIRYDDCKKWDAIAGSIHELERDDIWLAPFQCKLQQTVEERAGDDGEH